jgi:2,4-didehydro-3-deoxy-L-rhamnonate hydrolase
MRLYTFEHNGQASIGLEHEERLIDVPATYAETSRDIGIIPTDMMALIKAGEAGLQVVQKVLEFASSGKSISYAFEEVRLLAPIPRPGKILCSGINFVGHKEENPEAKMPTEPFFFSKLPSAVIGPDQPILYPGDDHQVDYEVELAIVIGKRMYKTPENEVMNCIAGYTILHDVSARAVQFKDNQITLGKNFDTFSPIGPCIVTSDELKEPNNLYLRTILNGQVMQDGSTREWIFSIPVLLSFLSKVMTLEPGDIVSTGTPAGIGYFRKPQIFLKPGDHVILEIEKIGKLANSVAEHVRET